MQEEPTLNLAIDLPETAPAAETQAVLLAVQCGALHRQGKLAEAEGALDKALKFQSRNAAVLEALALLCKQFERHDEALALFEKSFELDPENLHVRKCLANYYDTGERAIPHLQKIVEAGSDITWQQHLAVCYLQKEDFESAIRVLDRIVEAWPEDYQVWAEALGGCYIKIKKYEEGIPVLEPMVGRIALCRIRDKR